MSPPFEVPIPYDHHSRVFAVACFIVRLDGGSPFQLVLPPYVEPVRIRIPGGIATKVSGDYHPVPLWTLYESTAREMLRAGVVFPQHVFEPRAQPLGR